MTSANQEVETKNNTSGILTNDYGNPTPNDANKKQLQRYNFISNSQKEMESWETRLPMVLKHKEEGKN